jgi:hypothetical protein
MNGHRVDHVNADLLIQVLQRDRRVHMLFSRSVEGEIRPAMTENVLLDPPAALMMAEQLTTMAFEADTSLKPVTETLKASLVERHRQKLTPRLELMLNTLREERTASNAQLARTIIDQMFSEIFS